MYITKVTTKICLTVMVFSCLQSRAQDPENTEPELFLQGLVSSKYPERDMTFSPSGDLAYFTFQTYQFQHQMIMEMRKTAEGWTEPKVASFSGEHKDLEATFSPDGSRLYFSSNRPTDRSGEQVNFDIWYVNRQEDGEWSDPINIGAPINTDKNEFYPSIVNDGSLYFTSTDESGKGLEDIFYSKHNGNEFMKPVSLDSTINTKVFEFNAYVAPDESYILFSSYGREDGVGAGDLYISFKGTDNQWLPSVNLGPKINSEGLDYCPSISPDGMYLYFTSNRSTYDEMKKVKTKNDLQMAMDQLYNGFDNIYRVPVNMVLKRLKQ